MDVSLLKRRARRSLHVVWNSPTLLAAVSVFLAGLVLVEANVLSSRQFARFDITQQRLYTLSEPTQALLDDLAQPVEILLLLSNDDPLILDVRHLLDAYRARSNRISVRHIDPDRDTAEFLALGKQHDIAAERTQSGAVVSDAAFLIRSGSKKWFVRPSSLVARGEDGQPRPRIEAALTDGIAQVLEGQEQSLCFVTGHGEKSTDDAGRTGLGELSRRLSQSNIEPLRVPLDSPGYRAKLEQCDAIAVVGPERPLPDEHETALLNAWAGGTDFLLLLDPIVGPEGELSHHGLRRLTRAIGVEAKPGFVLERSAERRLPQGIGEAFMPRVKPHPVTRGLHSEQARTDARVVVVASLPVSPTGTSDAVPLLTTSDQGVVLSDLERLDAEASNQKTESVPVAAAVRSVSATNRDGRPSSSNEDLSARETRAVVVGSSQLAENRAFLDPAQYGNRLFVENAVSWLLERPTLVSVPEKPSVAAGLTLTEESQSELLRYVLIYMPLTAAALGAFVMMRRKSGEERSRKLAPSQGTRPEES